MLYSFLLKSLVLPALRNGLRVPFIALCSERIIFAQTYTYHLCRPLHFGLTSLLFRTSMQATIVQCHTPHTPSFISCHESSPTTVRPCSNSHGRDIDEESSIVMCTCYATSAMVFKVVAEVSLKSFTSTRTELVPPSSSKFHTTSIFLLRVASSRMLLYLCKIRKRDGVTVPFITPFYFFQLNLKSSSFCWLQLPKEPLYHVLLDHYMSISPITIAFS